MLSLLTHLFVPSSNCCVLGHIIKFVLFFVCSFLSIEFLHFSVHYSILFLPFSLPFFVPSSLCPLFLSSLPPSIPFSSIPVTLPSCTFPLCPPPSHPASLYHSPRPSVPYILMDILDMVTYAEQVISLFLFRVLWPHWVFHL